MCDFVSHGPASGSAVAILVPVHTLVMLAHAILAVIAAHERDREPCDASDLIPLSVNEIRHLFAKLITNTVRTIRYRLHWSTWRRRHQTRAGPATTPDAEASSIAIRQHNDPGLPY